MQILIDEELWQVKLSGVEVLEQNDMPTACSRNAWKEAEDVQ